MEKRKRKQYFRLVNVADRSVDKYIIPNALTPHRLQSKHKSLGSEYNIETMLVQYWTKMINTTNLLNTKFKFYFHHATVENACSNLD